MADPTDTPDETPTIDVPSDLEALDAVYALLDEEPAPEAPAEEPEEPGEEEEEPPEDPPAAPEPPAEPVPPSPPLDRDLADRLERAAAAERQLADRRREIDRARDDMEARLRDLEARAKRVEESEAWFRRVEEGDVLGAFEERGIDFDALSRGVATGSGARPQGALERRLAEQEKRLADYQAAQEAQAAARAEEERWNRVRQATAAEVEVRSPLLKALEGQGLELLVQRIRTEAEAGRQPTFESVFQSAHDEIYTFLDRCMSVDSVRERYLSGSDSEQQTPKSSQGATNAAASQPARRAKKQKVDPTEIMALPPEQQFDLLFPNGPPV